MRTCKLEKGAACLLFCRQRHGTFEAVDKGIQPHDALYIRDLKFRSSIRTAVFAFRFG